LQPAAGLVTVRRVENHGEVPEGTVNILTSPALLAAGVAGSNHVS